MKSALIHVLFLLFEICVFGDAEKAETISVIEGESVTLHTGVTVQSSPVIEWRLNGSRIAIISDIGNSTEGASRDRLQLDKQTGDLKITNIKTTDSGEYILKIKNSRTSDKTFSVSADPRSDGVKVVSVTEGESVVLHADTKILKDDEILWRFRGKDVIAKMKKDEEFFSINDGIADGIFRRRLHVNDQTGNLTISHITLKTSGLYEVDIKRRTYTIHKAFNVTITGSDLTWPVPVVAVLGVLLVLVFAAAAACVYYHRWRILLATDRLMKCCRGCCGEEVLGCCCGEEVL